MAATSGSRGGDAEIEWAIENEEELTLQPTNWEVEEDNNSICVCLLPKTEEIIECSSEICPIGLFHAGCVGFISAVKSGGDSGSASAGSTSTTTPAVPARTNASPWYCEFCCSEAEAGEKAAPLEVHLSNKPGQSEAEACTNGSAGSTIPRKKKKRNIPLYGSKVRATKAEVMADSTVILQEVLQGAEMEEHLKGTERGQGVLTIYRAMLAALTSVALLSFAQCIVEKVFEAASAGDHSSMGPVANEKVCTAFHTIRTDEMMNKLWEDILCHMNIILPASIAKLAQQYLMRKILLLVTKKRIQQDAEAARHEDVNLTDHDQNVIRYVAGYIPHALLKRYRKKFSSKARQICNILESWRMDQEEVEADSFLEYTCTWLNLVNRGGLFTVNDKLFKLFRAIEIQTQKLLNMNIAQSKNLGEFLARNIADNEHVLRCWQVVSEELCGEDNEILFSSLLNYWIKIRVKAYVKVYLNILRKDEILKKKEKKISRKGEKSLRKSLAMKKK